MKNSDQLLLSVGFGVILLDSLITYFTRTLFGVFLPVSIILPVLLLYITARNGLKIYDYRKSVLYAIVLGLFGVFVGFVLTGQLTITKLGAPILAVCAFLLGYLTFRWVVNDRVVENIVIAVSAAYIFVCIVALYSLYPSLFPVINAAWVHNGVVKLRPEVTTDQNFQIFYLMPIIAMLALKQGVFRFFVVLISSLLAVIVLIKLQTRSGVLVFVALMLVAWFAPIWGKDGGKGKLILLPVLMFFLLIYYHEALLNISNLLIARFEEQGAVGAAQGRLEALLYFFEKLIHPFYWLPQGYSDYMDTHNGDIPHANVTALYLEGGIFAFYMWLMIFVFPLFKLTRLFFAKKLGKLATIAIITGAGFLIVQMTLNVPFFKQPWLWAGAVMGALYRTREPQEVVKSESKNVSQVVETSSVRLRT